MWFKTRKNRRSTRRKQRGGALSTYGLTVRFHEGRVNVNANTSKEVNLSKVQQEPIVSWSKQLGKVTFICWDPDAPSPQNPSGYLHWFACDQVGTTPTAAAWTWTPPKPPHGFLHHYIFGIYKQMDGHMVQIPKERTPFSIDNFVEENKLTLLEKVGFRTQEKSWFG